jgi:glyoxylase-like metal-dependent hydrolase (beta-lactamase superfamily II)
MFCQETTELGFFAEEAPGLEVKTFRLALGGGGATMNCHLAWSPASREALVIDPGVPAPEVLEFIRARRLEVLAILNTHGHYDHVGGDAFLAATLSVPVYLHRADRRLAAPTTGPGVRFSDLPGHGRLALGKLEVEVLHTPGHSPGSVCLRIGDILFSGDTLFAGAVGKPHGDSRSRREASLRLEVEGIRRLLLALPPLTRVYPGHGESTTIGAEKTFNSFLN